MFGSKDNVHIIMTRLMLLTADPFNINDCISCLHNSLKLVIFLLLCYFSIHESQNELQGLLQLSVNAFRSIRYFTSSIFLKNFFLQFWFTQIVNVYICSSLATWKFLMLYALLFPYFLLNWMDHSSVTFWDTMH